MTEATGYLKSQTDTLLAAKVSTADIGNAETAAGAALNATITTHGDANYAGKELGYAEKSDFGMTNTTSNSGVAIPGLSVTATIGDKPVIVRWSGLCDVSASGTPATVYLDLYEDGSRVFRVAATPTGTDAQFATVNGVARRAPAAGEHTWTVRITSANNTSNVRVWTNTQYPATLQVVEV